MWTWYKFLSDSRYSISHFTVRVKKDDWSVVEGVGPVGEQHNSSRHRSAGRAFIYFFILLVVFFFDFVDLTWLHFCPGITVWHNLFFSFLSPFVVKSSCRATVALLSSRLLSSGSGQVRGTVIGLRPQVCHWGGATRESRWVNSLLISTSCSSIQFCFPSFFLFKMPFISGTSHVLC